MSDSDKETWWGNRNKKDLAEHDQKVKQILQAAAAERDARFAKKGYSWPAILFGSAIATGAAAFLTSLVTDSFGFTDIYPEPEIPPTRTPEPFPTATEVLPTATSTLSPEDEDATRVWGYAMGTVPAATPEQ